MDQRIAQISKCVEELLTTSYDLLSAKEEEDSQPPNRHLGPSPASRQHMEQLLLTHRQVNGACDSFLLDLQEADLVMDRLISQGWHPTPQAGDGMSAGTSSSAVMPMDHAEALARLDAAADSLILAPPATAAP